MSKDIKRVFLLDVEKKIVLSDRAKHDFLKVLEQNVENYITENPGASYNDLKNVFGTPEEIARAYHDTIDEQEIIHKLTTKKKFLIIFIVFIALLLLVYGFYYYRLVRELPVYTVEEIKELD